ncbi:hypothetical protein F2Q69_00059778 [Brassica cretica]|uniref:Uncharacterized protein n=1 Tax=Brassica cretica TaxID=69181 RepID=A0A8S9RK04_BRACR|nr:hypothetical protein F2Q69_00059778 [Brassica cretica]
MPASVEKSPPAAPSTTMRSGSLSKGNSRITWSLNIPRVKDLIFKDAYVDAARTKILSDGSMNFVVEMYDTALKETISKLKQADQLVRVKDTTLNRKMSEFKAAIDKAAAEKCRLLEEKKAQKEKFAELKGKSNANLIDAGTAAILQTPTSSQGDHAIERSNEQTGRDLEGLSVQERGDVSGVERTEDTSEPMTAPDVSNQAPVALDLMVREDRRFRHLELAMRTRLFLWSNFQILQLRKMGISQTNRFPRAIHKEKRGISGSLRPRYKATLMKLRTRLIRQQMGLEVPLTRS